MDLATDTYTDAVKETRKERKARSESIGILTGEGYSGCSGSLANRKGGKKTGKNQDRAIGSDGFRAHCSVANHFMRGSVRETTTRGAREQRKSALAIEQPQF